MILLGNSTQPKTGKNYHHPTFVQYKKKCHQFILKNKFKSEKTTKKKFNWV
jgi:hypothetical protein